MGSHLLVINIKRTRFVFDGTREFLAIMVRVLFIRELPTRSRVVNELRRKGTTRSKREQIFSVAVTYVPSPGVSGSSFSDVADVVQSANSWISHSSGQLRKLENIRPVQLTATQRVWGRGQGYQSLPRAPCPVLASLLRPFPLHPSKISSITALKNLSHSSITRNGKRQCPPSCR
jgi:hypothetical protein